VVEDFAIVAIGIVGFRAANIEIELLRGGVDGAALTSIGYMVASVLRSRTFSSTLISIVTPTGQQFSVAAKFRSGTCTGT
jgi:hypothetical protein